MPDFEDMSLETFIETVLPLEPQDADDCLNAKRRRVLQDIILRERASAAYVNGQEWIDLVRALVAEASRYRAELKKLNPGYASK